MKHIRQSAVMCALLIVAVCFSASAQQPLDMEKAKEGEIRGSAGIGMGATGGSYLIVLPLGTMWLDTGIDVGSGDTVTITAVPSKGRPPCDGTGCPPYREPDDMITGGTAGWRLAALVGRINDAGTPFSVGKRYEAEVPESGRLFVGSNDCAGCYGNNTGAFEVTIEVKKK